MSQTYFMPIHSVNVHLGVKNYHLSKLEIHVFSKPPTASMTESIKDRYSSDANQIHSKKGKQCLSEGLGGRKLVLIASELLDCLSTFARSQGRGTAP